MDVRHGSKPIDEAVGDPKIDAGLRLKIKNYLNKDRAFIDGIWVDRKRSALEEVVVRTYCHKPISFDDFERLYNDFLRQHEIEDIYITDDVRRTRKARLSEAHCVLWKQGEQFRYYDIDGRDFTELLDELDLDSFENIEISTAKLMEDHPEILRRYDIRDQYELHNLLRKIVPDGSYHRFHCTRMPNIVFGTFDRDSALFDLLIDNAPISNTDLAQLIHDEYGYDTAIILSTYLQHFTEYYHQGMYTIDQKVMSAENRNLLQSALTDDFYYIDEIRRIYQKLVPGAVAEEINPYNLKLMGFQVMSRYVLQHYPTLDAYFTHMLTADDIVDIRESRKRFSYVQAFSQTLTGLKKSLQIVEFEPNQFISIRRLERSGVDRQAIRVFCEAVWDFVPDGTYFSIRSLRQDGFESDLYDLGFGDWFYASLLISDSRFSYSTMFGCIIFYKGSKEVTIKAFESDLINRVG